MLLKGYFEGIRTQRAVLTQQFPEGCCFVTSRGAPGRNVTPGCVAQVTIDIAARLLHEGSHRLSTDAEIEEFRQKQELNRARSPLTDALENARAQFQAILAKKDGQK